LGSNHYIGSSEFDYPTQPATATFRILLNSTEIFSSSSYPGGAKFGGLVWDYWKPELQEFSQTKGGLFSEAQIWSVSNPFGNFQLNTDGFLGSVGAYISFGALPISGTNRTGCMYVDLTWFYPEGKAKVFYKTSTGAAGFINLRYIDGIT
jgi:hypothetical protein